MIWHWASKDPPSQQTRFFTVLSWSVNIWIWNSKGSKGLVFGLHNAIFCLQQQIFNDHGISNSYVKQTPARHWGKMSSLMLFACVQEWLSTVKGDGRTASFKSAFAHCSQRSFGTIQPVLLPLYLRFQSRINGQNHPEEITSQWWQCENSHCHTHITGISYHFKDLSLIFAVVACETN